MLTIRDYNNNEYPLLAIKTINEELNGQHSIELKIPKQNNLDLKLIDKLWEINYQTIDYKIMYVKQVTKGDSFYLDVRAIPLFYWDMDKQIVHENKDGHYTGTNAFTDLFKGTGYQYVLVDFVEAIQIDGYGKGETRLEMFKRLIERFGLEFYIVGKTVYLKKLIGNDTNFMYKYKLNASNVSKSIDASNFFTHVKGFGNFEEGSENYLSDAKLQREYTSPLATIVGVYEGKPIVDGRIKDIATMDANMKKAVEDSLEISIDGNLHDVRSIYAEAVPTIGDRVFLIDERINLEQEIRIHTLKSTYDANDKLIDCEVTFGSQNIRDRYKSNLNSAAKNFTALMKGDIKLPTWSLDEIARGMITKIHASENELKYGSFGIQAIDKNNPNNVFGLNSQGWYISTDGGRTARTIATAEGILAESIIGNHLIGLQLTSPGESGYFHVAGNYAEFVNDTNNNKVSISPQGLYGTNASGATVFQADSQMVTSGALSSRTSNVYVAAETGFEARIVDRNGLPRDGDPSEYSYLPVRTLGIKSPPNANLYLGVDGTELRVMSLSFLSGGIYRDVRGQEALFTALRLNQATSAQHMYISPASGGEVRLTTNLDTLYARLRCLDIRANEIYPNTGNNLILRHVYNNEVRVLAGGTENLGRMTVGTLTYNTLTQSSLESLKTNIKPMEDGVLDLYRNELDLCEFEYIQTPHVSNHGVIIGENYKVPKFWLRDGTVKVSSVIFHNAKAIQELISENDELKIRLEKLEEKIA